MGLFNNKKKQNRNNRKGSYKKATSMAHDNRAALNAMRANEEQASAEYERIRRDVYKMIDQGTGRIEDLWAPPRMKILNDYIELGEETLAVCTVSNWPSELTYGWLNALLEDPELAHVKIDASVHIHPIRKEWALQYLNDKKMAAESSAMAENIQDERKNKNQRIYKEQARSSEQLYQLLDNNANENLFQVSVVFGIYGKAEFEIDKKTGDKNLIKSSRQDVIEKTNTFRKVLARISGGGFAMKPLLHQQRDGIKSLLPWGYGGLHSFQTMYTSALATSYPFLHGNLQIKDGILYGVNPRTHSPYFFNSFDTDWVNAYNVVVIGNTGSGKSATLKTLLGRYALRGTQIFIIDPAINTKGEYVNLANSLDGTVIDFGGNDDLYLNPFELLVPTGWDYTKETDQNLSAEIYKNKRDYLVGLFDIMKNIYIQENGQMPELENYKNLLEVMIDRTYVYKNISTRMGKWDWNQWTEDRLPTINDFAEVLRTYIDIINAYKNRDQVIGWLAANTNNKGLTSRDTFSRIMYIYAMSVQQKLQPSVFQEKELKVIEFIYNFISEYIVNKDKENYSEKASLFAGTKKADMNNQCIVLRFTSKNESIKQLATYLSFELIYNRINQSNNNSNNGYKNYIVAMDECWKLLSSNYARNYVIKISREGRKLNTGLWVISQKYEDFTGDNSVLFSQAPTKIIMGLSGDEVDILRDELDLSSSLCQLINTDKTAVTPGTGLLCVNGKKKKINAGFYCIMSELERRISDTSDATRKPLTKKEIIDIASQR